MYLARLKRYQPSLLFYVTLTEELALKQAAEADREIKAGKYRGPLHGLPWGAKDLFATKGIKTTWGAEPYDEQILDYDATIVERLRDAGAVLVGEAHARRAGAGRPLVRRPHQQSVEPAGRARADRRPVPGSATAAGCVAFAIGTETQGSILSPSSINGLVGLRPTYGRVSRYGAMALSTTMDKIGPMCRYVEDAVLVLQRDLRSRQARRQRGGRGVQVESGHAARRLQDRLPPQRLRARRRTRRTRAVARRRRRRLRPELAAAGAGAAAPARRRAGRRRTRAALAAAGSRCRRNNFKTSSNTYRKLGAQIEAVDPPDGTIAQAIGFILQVESAASFDDITRSGDINSVATGTSRSTWPATFRQGRFVPAVEYIRAMRARTLLMRQMDEYMSKYDAILSPGDSMSTITNRTGHPAVSVKAGIVDGTPRPLIITGQAVRGSDDPPHRAGVRTGDGVERQTSDAWKLERGGRSRHEEELESERARVTARSRRAVRRAVGLRATELSRSAVPASCPVSASRPSPA